MKRYELITLILAIIFGLVGAWLFETLGDLGEWLSVFCLIPPGLYYFYFEVWRLHSHPALLEEDKPTVTISQCRKTITTHTKS